MAMTNFRAIDMLAATDNPAAAKATEPKKTEVPSELSPENTEAVESDDAVPSGSAAEVLTWVGDDKDRARQALDQEKSSATPRKGLSADLEELANK